MASEKVLAGLEAIGSALTAPVLAADTAVVLDERVLGKPRDEGQAMDMLHALSGRMHRVISAVAISADIRHQPGTGGGPRCVTSISRVWFRETTLEERHHYCATGEPLDKAGAYAIQGRAAMFVARLDGSYSGVMGLPLFETAALLREAGIRV